ncbi:unnamed protein product [Symbiodinium natans]|uniref:Uncharacterized protein n=1 Tax=Symbiodinium natans TaxID=878477 RepID=A0A812PMW7_9DINO|nr:unnamed protein product [Symbiodinium natans]
MSEVGDLVYVVVRSEGRDVPVAGWAVSLPKTNIIVGTAPEAVEIIGQKKVVGSGEKAVAFLRVPQTSTTLCQPEGWSGLRPKDLPSLSECQTGWKRGNAADIESSEAECPVTAKSRKQRPGEDDDEPDLKQVMLQSLAKGGDPGQTMQLLMISGDLLGGTSSGSSDDEEGDGKRGMKAVVTLRKLREEIHRRPRRVWENFEKEMREELGVIPGQAWTVRDYLKRQNWGRFKGLYRCAEVKQKMQAVLHQGDWSTAWLLTGLSDPLQKKEWAGSKEEMAVISGYQEAVLKLRKKVSEAQGRAEAEEDEAATASTLLERSGSSISLFPCALPYPEVLQTGGALDGRAAALWWSKASLNAFVAWSNFVVLGCPRPGSSGYEPRVGYRSVQDARLFADRLLGEMEEFASEDVVFETLECSGKRALLEELIGQVPGAVAGYPDDRAQVGAISSASTALPVVAERVAVPAEAGSVDPLDWLPVERAEIVNNLAKHRLPEHLWERVPRAFHNVPEAEEKVVAEKLLATGMAVLVAEKDLPRDMDGNLLTGGLFSVPKNESEDRLIYDRRPENGTMVKLPWARLPSACCFTRMLLREDEYLRGSGDDLRNYYYSLKLPANWVKYNSVGRPVAPELVRQRGLDPRQTYRLCFRVLGMGDVNGCAIAQATHEAVLQKFGLLRAENLLVYGQHAPKSEVWEGVYLDDLLITAKVRAGGPVAQDGSFCPREPEAGDEDVMKVRAAEAAYLEAGLERAVHKEFRMLTQFRAWGAHVDGVRGRVGAPLETRRQVWKLTSAIVRVGRATKVILQKLAGFLAFIFGFRRELFCLLHHFFNFVSNMKEGIWIRLPEFLLDELRSVALHLPVAVWCMRKKLCCSLLATDATPTSGGAVRAQIQPDLAQELWRRSEIRGKAVRLDRQEPPDLMEEEPVRPSLFGSRLAESLEWSATASYSFRQTSHVNLQEYRALGRELRRFCSDLANAGTIQLGSMTLLLWSVWLLKEGLVRIS